MQGTDTPANDLTPGFMLVQGNRLEDLRALLTQWLQRQPLHPLEDETLLVQSNGIAQWLRLALAAPAAEGGCGIAAALDIKLPGKFVWQAYRAVLGDLPTSSPYDKAPLTWRLYRLLGDLDALASNATERGWLAPLRGFLDGIPAADPVAPATSVAIPAELAGHARPPGPDGSGEDTPRRRYQLAARLADLYDQYQIFRADWLAAWQDGHNHLPNGSAPPTVLADEHCWQPLLWRHICADTQAGGADDPARWSRSALHARFIAEARKLSTNNRPEELPRRIVVFGISSLPRQVIEVLKALSPVCQVLLCVHNPCRHYWGDIVEGRELFRQAYRRISDRKVPEDTDETSLHLHGHPLLAAWGRQGRDYIRLLDEFDDAEQYRDQLKDEGLRIDLFEPPAAEHLLAQIQHDILDLVPLQERRAASHPQHSTAEAQSIGTAASTDARTSARADAPTSNAAGHPASAAPPDGESEDAQAIDLGVAPSDPDTVLVAPVDPAQDRSLEFLIAHSPQREVEILHDQLLAAFAEATAAGEPLAPRDILVMVPDIAAYAPHIQAVFGLTGREDPRHIPFHIADQGQRQRHPLLVGLETLLQLPQARFSVTELLDLLDIPALRARFGLDEADLPRLRAWIRDANIRWGLHAPQRASLGLPPGLERTSWRFGLQRMLLGFAAGDAGPWRDIEPQAAVRGLDAALVGALYALLDTLAGYWQRLQQEHTPVAWAGVIGAMLDDLFRADTSTEQNLLLRLREALEAWSEQCALAGAADAALPLAVVSDALLPELDSPTLSQRFLAGAVNFATLMPMRAIPFRQIWLLGMNDGDYPRSRRPADFDLMGLPGQYRPGDRSRREDDRYLFLEALLSARDKLGISWVGRSIQDDSELPPSVLVGQLRDHIAAGWGQQVLDALTTTHPLQPFSPRYFAPEADASPEHPSRLFTYAGEWYGVHAQNSTALVQPATALGAPVIEEPITLAQLGAWLRHPLQHVYQQRLAVHLTADTDEIEDDEPFHFDPLGTWALYNRTLTLAEPALIRDPTADVGALLIAVAAQLRDRGELPLPPFDAHWAAWIADQLAPALQDYAAQLAAHPEALRPSEVRVEGGQVRLLDRLEQLRHAADRDTRLILRLSASKVLKVTNNRAEFEWHNLVRYWPTHLAAQIAGPTRTRLIGPTGAVTLEPLASADAQATLDALLQAYYGTLSQLPALACKTAFAWLRQDKKVHEVYEGTQQRDGEISSHPAYVRFWPDFDRLQADPGFATLSETLYRPLFDTRLTQETFGQ